MLRVNSAAFGAATLLASTFLLATVDTAEAKRLRLIPTGGSSSSSGQSESGSAAQSADNGSGKSYLASNDKPTAADTGEAKSRGELARMRADRALTENGEKSKSEDEEVMSKDDKDPDDTTATAAKGEPVAPKPTSKITCIAGCN